MILMDCAVRQNAPLSIKETKMEAMTGRVLAIDASMCLYQFLVAVRQGEAQTNLSNADGEVTSHIQGFLSRTVKMLELGIKPAYVFDGKPPELKQQTLAGRAERKAEADADLAAALEGGDAEEIRKAAHRTARATPQMNADVQELLRLLGCPVILAPSEAEASCAALCRAGKAYATATEDMDALTFGTPVMLKNFFDTESSRTQTKRPVWEVRLDTMLQQLDVPMDRFIDFCIVRVTAAAPASRRISPRLWQGARSGGRIGQWWAGQEKGQRKARACASPVAVVSAHHVPPYAAACLPPTARQMFASTPPASIPPPTLPFPDQMCGCDYCGTIRGVGPPTAFKMLRAHGTLEGAISALDAAKRPPPDEWPIDAARALFRQPETIDTTSVELAWRAPDVAGLRAFLVDRHSFNEGRVARYIERLQASRASGSQTRLDSFFRASAPKAVPDGAKFDPFKRKASGVGGDASAAAGAKGKGKGRASAAGASGAGSKKPRRA